MNKKNNITLSSPWIWVVPLVSMTGLAIVWLTGANQDLFLWLNALGTNSTASVIWANITILGDTLVAFALLSPFIRRRPDVIWAIIIAAIFAMFWVHGLKYFIGNPRPGAVLPKDMINIIGVHLRGGSFPSGHTTTAFVLSGVICTLRLHPALSWIALILAILTGISRAAVGAHWPMDIFAGAFGGWLTAVIGVISYRKLSEKKPWGTQRPGKIFLNAGLFLIALTLFFYYNGYPASIAFQNTIGAITIIITVYNFSQLLFLANEKTNKQKNFTVTKDTQPDEQK